MALDFDVTGYSTSVSVNLHSSVLDLRLPTFQGKESFEQVYLMTC